MTLRKIEIERERWGVNEGKYKGSMAIDDDTVSMTMELDDVACAALLKCVAEQLALSAMRMHNGFANKLSDVLKGGAK